MLLAVRVELVGIVLEQSLAEAVDASERGAKVVSNRVAEGLELAVRGFRSVLRAGHGFALARKLDVRPYAGEKLARGERLDEVVVGARLQALDGRVFARPRRQEDDGNVAQGRVGAQRSQEAETVEARHHHVA